ncbi:MAG: cysteine desulfurase [Clostridiales bacterium]|jgi:cysteine desulfurase|nr:cysteine desulfurase [Clostridiales bacterium]
MIYFDNAATTATDPRLRTLLDSLMYENFGNPSSAHKLGLEGERAVKSATSKLASVFGASGEIYYTSGGTESNNLALVGVARAKAKRGRHIIISRAEHPSVENTARYLESEGFTVTRADVSELGAPTASDVLSLIQPDTILVSLIHVNNETGAITDIAGIARQIKALRGDITIHTDHVQGFCKENLDLSHVDLCSISGHKIHAPKGVGALLARREQSKSTRLVPLLYGGGQQSGIRPGTENVPAIAALAEAARFANEKQADNLAGVRAIKNEIASLASDLPDVYINGHADGSPYILNMSFVGVNSETLVNALSLAGIYISNGSACNSRSSHTSLNYLRLGQDRLRSAARFSFSSTNTIEEAKIARAAIVNELNKLRRFGRRP